MWNWWNSSIFLYLFCWWTYDVSVHFFLDYRQKRIKIRYIYIFFSSEVLFVCLFFVRHFDFAVAASTINVNSKLWFAMTASFGCSWSGFYHFSFSFLTWCAAFFLIPSPSLSTSTNCALFPERSVEAGQSLSCPCPLRLQDKPIPAQRPQTAHAAGLALDGCL